MRSSLILLFDNEQIHITEVCRKRKRIIILRAWKHEMPSGCRTEDGAIEPKAMAELWQKIEKQDRIRSKEVCIVIPSDQVICREVEMPYFDIPKAQKVFSINSDLYFPIPLADYTLAFQKTEKKAWKRNEWRLGSQKKLSRVHYFVSAAPDRIIQSCFEFAENAHLKLHTICDENSCVCQILQYEAGTENVISLYVGKDKLLFFLFENGNLLLRRAIPAKTAERDMEQTLRYYKRRFMDKELSGIRIYGERQEAERWKMWLEKLEAFEVELCGCPDWIHKKQNSQEEMESGVNLAIIGGAWMPEYFISRKMKSLLEKKQLFHKFRIVLMLMILIEISLLVQPLTKYVDAATERMGLGYQIRHMEREFPYLEEYEQDKLRYDLLSELQNSIGREDHVLLCVMERLSKYQQKGAKLTMLHMRKEELSIEMDVPDKKMTADLMCELEQCSELNDIRIGALTRKNEMWSININMSGKKNERAGDQQGFDEGDEYDEISN